MNATTIYLIGRVADPSLSWANRQEASRELVEGHGFESLETSESESLFFNGHLIANVPNGSHNSKLDQIEAIMDSCANHTEFLELVAEVFSAKADHLRSNWQDECMAQIYDCNAAALLEVPGMVEKAMS